MKKLVIAVAMVAGCSVQGALVAGWDVAGVDLGGGIGVETNASPFTFYATTGETARVTARLVLGAGVNPTTPAGQYGFKISQATQTNSLAGAVALEHYMEISIAVDAGHAHLRGVEAQSSVRSAPCRVRGSPLRTMPSWCCC